MCLTRIIITLLFLSFLPLTTCNYQVVRVPQNLTKFVGDNASFECEFDNDGALFGASYWEYRLDQDLQFREITHELKNFTLLNTHSQNESFGHTQCVLNEVTREHHNLAIRCGFSTFMLEAFLFVYSDPVLYLQKDIYKEVQGETLVVIFSTGGYPDPIYSDTFYWLHNSQLIENSDSIQLTSISITFTSLQSYHTGRYNLTTSNVVGNATADFYIEVLYPPQVGFGTLSVTEEFVVVGENVTLNCRETEANPTPTTEWFKDNSSITNTNTLTLTEISLMDHGLYICNVSNHLGYVTTEIQLIVYGPASAPVWERETLETRATEIYFVWARPVETYGLEVDFYELNITSQNTSVIIDIPGYNLSYLASYEIYPDTVYRAIITAHTYNNTLRGNSSLPLTIRTLKSPPILSSITSRIQNTGIFIMWVLYSSGAANANVGYYQIKVQSLTDNIIYRTRYTSFIADYFESHSTYTITVFGSRQGLKGLSLQTEIYTGGYGIPPTAVLLQTQQIQSETRTNITFEIARVPSPYMEFSIRIFCKENNSTIRLSVSETISGFEGGNLSLILNQTKLSSYYNCIAKFSNYFGNKTVIFTHAGPNYNQTTTQTTTTTSTPIIPFLEPFTPFRTAIIVVIATLLMLTICIALIVLIIVYLCLRNHFKKFYFPIGADREKCKIEKSVSKDGFGYGEMEIADKSSLRESVYIDTVCETTSV